MRSIQKEKEGGEEKDQEVVKICANCGGDTMVTLILSRNKKDRIVKVKYVFRSRYKDTDGKIICRRCYKNVRLRLYRVKLMQVLSGGLVIKCEHCGYDKDIRALQIDHRFGGGKAEQIKHGNCHMMYYYYLKNIEEAKKNLQILCCNCNRIKVHVLKEFANMEKRKKEGSIN